jgi:hypothetical protein
MGFLLVIEFTDQFQIVTAGNYGALANSQSLQFTTAHTKSSQFFTGRFLVMNPNNVLYLRSY